MSYSVCRSGGKMCDGCMRCYGRFEDYDEDVYPDKDDGEEEEEEDEDDDY